MGMNSFELIPTEENLIHTLDKDLLKRNKDLVRFYDLILVQEGASSIAIDGRWGSGKTFFVKQSILVGLKIVDISLYNQFVCGKSSKPLMDIYKDSDKGEWLATRLLNRNEAFEVEEGKSVVTVEQKIQQLYDAIFVTEYTGNVYHTILGEYEFDDNSKNFVKSVESMLSVYADYNI